MEFRVPEGNLYRDVYQKRKVEKEENLYGSEDWKRWLGFKIQGYKSSILIAMSTVLSKDIISGINEST